MKFNLNAIKDWFNPSNYSASTKNWVKGLTALSLLASGTGSLAYLAGGIGSLYTTLAMNAAITFGAAWYSKEIAFWLYSIKPVQPGELVEGFDLHAMVQEIALHPHIACHMPALGIYETDKLNAFATGRHTGHSGVAITRGLLKYANQYAKNTDFTPDQLIKGILFHELGHVSHHDVAIQSSISILALLFTKVCHIAYEKVITNPENKKADKDTDKNKEQTKNSLTSKYLVPVVFVLGWTGSTLSKLLSRWFSRTRETCADETAFQCGYGPQLAAALKMLEEGSKTEGLSSSTKVNSLFSDDALESTLFCHHHAHDKEDKQPKNKGVITWAFEALSSHPPIDERIEHLQALELERESAANRMKMH